MHASFKKRRLGREKLLGTILTLPAPELAEIAADGERTQGIFERSFRNSEPFIILCISVNCLRS
jgi:hypothetical protein